VDLRTVTYEKRPGLVTDGTFFQPSGSPPLASFRFFPAGLESATAAARASVFGVVAAAGTAVTVVTAVTGMLA
jgi:hypothetical protein